MPADDKKGTRDNPNTVRLDEIAGKIVADPKNAGETVLVNGFLGAASEPDQVRIYWDASFSSYVEAQRADIVHVEPLPKEQAPLGGSYIWVKRDARVAFGGAGGSQAAGRFFEGPLMAAYGGQFGAAGGTTGAGAALPASFGPICRYTIFYNCHSYLRPCFTPLCTRTAWACSAFCPVASPGCPQVGPGTPVQNPVGGGPMEAQFQANAPEAAGFGIPSLVCSYSPGCWYSWGACPTQGWCGGPHPTPRCPQLQAAAFPGSYAAGCWHSWNACPTDAGCGAGPSHGHPCTQAVMGGAFPGSYAPGCWHSWNACPTDFGCGPHISHPCTQAVMGGAFPGSYAPGCWHSWNACPTDFGCGPHHTPACPR